MNTKHIERTVREVSLGEDSTDIYVTILSADLTVQSKGRGVERTLRDDSVEIEIRKISDDSDITSLLPMDTVADLKEEAIDLLMNRTETDLTSSGIVLAPFKKITETQK